MSDLFYGFTVPPKQEPLAEKDEYCSDAGCVSYSCHNCLFASTSDDSVFYKWLKEGGYDQEET